MIKVKSALNNSLDSTRLNIEEKEKLRNWDTLKLHPLLSRLLTFFDTSDFRFSETTTNYFKGGMLQSLGCPKK